MKTFKDCEIICQDLDLFKTKLNTQIESLGDGWSFYEKSVYIYVGYDGWEADVCLSYESFSTNQKLTVPNIIPREKEPIHLSEYNKILEEFIEKIVNPILKDTNTTIKSTTGEINIIDFFGKQATNSLNLFLTEIKGKILPDLQYQFSSNWFAFILDCFFSGRICFNYEELKSLFLDEGFPEKESDYLALEYEKMINFFSYYEAEYKMTYRG